MNKNSKIFTIIRHEYLTKVRTKGFVIGTILGPLAIVLIIATIAFVAVMSEDSGIKKIAVIDYSNLIGEKLIAADTSRYFATNKPEKVLSEMVFEEKIDGYLVIPKDILESNVVRVFTRGGGGLAFIEKIETQVGHFNRIERLKSLGLDVSVINVVEQGCRVETEKITETGTEKDYTEAYAVLGYVLGFAIYMFMLIYGSFVSRGVIEEKANRIIEVIASSAKPFEIMMGKILGIGLVGLTQVVFWILMFVGLVYIGQPILMNYMSDPALLSPGMMSPEQIEIQANMSVLKDFVNPGILIAFLFYFLSGYFIYSTIFAAIGSAVDQESDAQQLMTPVTMLIVIPMLFISVVMSNPDSTISIVLSLIPFFAPILMIVRIAATQVPIWQIATSVLFIIGTFFGLVWLASRIYRVGILMYGKKPSIKDLAKWVKI